MKGLGSLGRIDSEEFEYLRANPHGSELAEVCKIAGVGYGRIDYAVIDDRVVTWEINTSAYVLSKRDDSSSTLPTLEMGLPLTEEPLAEIDPGPTNQRIDISDAARNKSTRSAQ